MSQAEINSPFEHINAIVKDNKSFHHWQHLWRILQKNTASISFSTSIPISLFELFLATQMILQKTTSDSRKILILCTLNKVCDYSHSFKAEKYRLDLDWVVKGFRDCQNAQLRELWAKLLIKCVKKNLIIVLSTKEQGATLRYIIKKDLLFELSHFHTGWLNILPIFVQCLLKAERHVTKNTKWTIAQLYEKLEQKIFDLRLDESNTSMMIRWCELASFLVKSSLVKSRNNSEPRYIGLWKSYLLKTEPIYQRQIAISISQFIQSTIPLMQFPSVFSKDALPLCFAQLNMLCDCYARKGEILVYLSFAVDFLQISPNHMLKEDDLTFLFKLDSQDVEILKWSLKVFCFFLDNSYFSDLKSSSNLVEVVFQQIKACITQYTLESANLSYYLLNSLFKIFKFVPKFMQSEDTWLVLEFLLKNVDNILTFDSEKKSHGRTIQAYWDIFFKLCQSSVGMKIFRVRSFEFFKKWFQVSCKLCELASESLKLEILKISRQIFDFVAHNPELKRNYLTYVNNPSILDLVKALYGFISKPYQNEYYRNWFSLMENIVNHVQYDLLESTDFFAGFGNTIKSTENEEYFAVKISQMLKKMIFTFGDSKNDLSFKERIVRLARKGKIFDLLAPWVRINKVDVNWLKISISPLLKEATLILKDNYFLIESLCVAEFLNVESLMAEDTITGVLISTVCSENPLQTRAAVLIKWIFQQIVNNERQRYIQTPSFIQPAKQDRLLESSKINKITFVVGQTKLLFANASFLMSLSPFFEAMSRKKFKVDIVDGAIEVEYHDLEAIKALVEVLDCTRRSRFNTYDPFLLFRLYLCADYFMLEKVQLLCEAFLSEFYKCGKRIGFKEATDMQRYCLKHGKFKFPKAITYELVESMSELVESEYWQNWSYESTTNLLQDAFLFAQK